MRGRDRWEATLRITTNAKDATPAHQKGKTTKKRIVASMPETTGLTEEDPAREQPATRRGLKEPKRGNPPT